MEAIGTLAGGIAHDFNNMLAIIMGNTEMAMDDVRDGVLPGRSLDHILSAVKRGRDLVKEILTFSRKAQRERTPTDVISVLHETFSLLRSTLPTTITMSLDIQSESGIMLGDPVQVEQILMNLATNAAHAMRNAGGTLAIRLIDAAFQSDDILPDPDMKPGRYLKLIVEDTGTGMTDEVRSRIFEPFFTTKGVGQGTGMGLSVVYGIVKSYNGALEVESTPGKGSTFAIYLPKAESPAGNGEDAAKVVWGNQEHVLFIDDEHPLTEVAEAMLKKLGYRVTAMTDSREAWKLFLEDPRAFDLVITDQTMPDLTGVTLAQKMIRIRPDVPVIVCTGYSETVSPEEARKAGVREFLMKPLVRDELAAAIRRALDGVEGGQ
jgi:CheY-like chemotaxis protein/anti-sigma regulatory factor (Ser/Thr protein kinase)